MYDPTGTMPAGSSPPVTDAFGSSQTTLRQPRAYIVVNGTTMPAPLAAGVTSNNYAEADTFGFTFAVSSLPADKQAAFWADTDDISAEVLIGVEGEPAVSLVTGKVDEVEWLPEEGTVTVRGRDRTAELLDAKTTERWANRTASEVATILAQRHGLTPVVTATSGRIGTFSQDEQASNPTEISEWRYLSYLAEMTNSRVYVRGNELHFEPDDDGTSKGAFVWDMSGDYPRANLSRPFFARNLTLAKDVSVVVITWDSKKKRPIKATVHRSRVVNGQRRASGAGQTYTFRRAGLTLDQAQKFAQSKAEDITRHERVAQIEIPGELTLFAGNRVTLRGTGTSFDQDYWLDEVTRTIDRRRGFVQRLRMKNHGTVSDTTF